MAANAAYNSIRHSCRVSLDANAVHAQTIEVSKSSSVLFRGVFACSRRGSVRLMLPVRANTLAASFSSGQAASFKEEAQRNRLKGTLLKRSQIGGIQNCLFLTSLLFHCNELEGAKHLPVLTKTRQTLHMTKASLDADLSEQLSGHRKEAGMVNTVLGLGVLVGADQALQAALPNSALPSALVGCLLLTSALLIIDQVSQPAARDIAAFFGPATEFLQRWLPLFYTPAIVMLPRVLRAMPVTEGIKVGLLLVVGLVLSFAQAGGLAALVRRVKPSDRLRPAQHMPNVAPFTLTELIPWAALTAGAALAFSVAPTLAGSEALTAAPGLLGATVTGFLLTAWLPGPIKRLVHPSLVAAVAVNALVVMGGQSLGRSWESVLGLYSTGNIRSPGAADILSSFIGPSILALAFTLNRQKELIRDHLPELGVVIPLSALFSLFSIAFLGRRLNLDPALSMSLSTRFVSPQAAAPLAPLIGGDASIMAGASILTGVLGSTFNSWLLSLAGFTDPVARALAVSCSSHSLGSAALAAKDEDLLPFAQVAYSLMVLFVLGACSSNFVTGQIGRLAGA